MPTPWARRSSPAVLTGVFASLYNMKGSEAHACDLSLGGEQPSRCYSQQAIDLMFQELRRDPEHVRDVTGHRDSAARVDIDPFSVYEAPRVADPLEVVA